MGMKKTLYVTFRKVIEADHEANMNAIPRKQRAMVRKGLQVSLLFEIEDTVEILHTPMRKACAILAPPVFGKYYFQNLKNIFADNCEILTVTHEGKLVSSVMSFYFKDEVLPYYGGGTSLARHLKANDYMYWQVMSRAADKGCRVFDYGRSKQGAGSYSFKKNWGFEPQPLHYGYKLVNATSVPDISPMNPKYQLFIKCWKKLPVAISNRVGPLIAKNLG